MNFKWTEAEEVKLLSLIKSPSMKIKGADGNRTDRINWYRIARYLNFTFRNNRSNLGCRVRWQKLKREIK